MLGICHSKCHVTSRHVVSSHHWWSETESIIDSLNHILIGPIPIWPLSVRHDLPHNYAIRPHVGRRSELPVCNRFRSCPAHRYLAASGGVRAGSVVTLDFSRETEVGDLANEILVYENIARSQILKKYTK